MRRKIRFCRELSWACRKNLPEYLALNRISAQSILRVREPMALELNRAETKKGPLIDTYRSWSEGEGLPVIKGYSVPDIQAVPLKPWRRKGGLGAFIQLVGGEN